MVSQTNTTAVLSNPKNALWKGSLLKGVEEQVHPPELQNQVMGVLEDVDNSLDRITEEVFGKPAHPPTEFSQYMWNQTLWAFRADVTYVRVARNLLEMEEPFDLLAVYIGAPDVSGHRFCGMPTPRSSNTLHPASRSRISAASSKTATNTSTAASAKSWKQLPRVRSS